MSELKELQLEHIEMLSLDYLDRCGGDYSLCESSWRSFGSVFKTASEASKLLDIMAATKEKLISAEVDIPLDRFEPDYILRVLSLGGVVYDLNRAYRVKTTLPKCPICGSSLILDHCIFCSKLPVE